MPAGRSLRDEEDEPVEVEEDARGRGRGSRRYEDDVDEDVEKEDASPEELCSIQVLRSQLEAWHDQPFFNGDGMSGVVVRMAYGAQMGGQQYVLMVVSGLPDLEDRDAGCGEAGEPWA